MTTTRTGAAALVLLAVFATTGHSGAVTIGLAAALVTYLAVALAIHEWLWRRRAKQAQQ